MGECCSKRGSPKPPVRQPSDGDVKVKVVEDIGLLPPTEDIETVEPHFNTEKPPKKVKFYTIEEQIRTGDLAVLLREGQDIPHFGIFIENSKCDPEFPLLLVKGRTKPLPIDKFQPLYGRECHPVSAVTRIFYGDYKEVAIQHLLVDNITRNSSCDNILQIVEHVQKIPFTKMELREIKAASTPQERSSLVAAFMVAHFYHLMGVFNGDPVKVSSHTLRDGLNLSPPTYIKLPPVKPGPVTTGDAPLLFKLIDGLLPPPEEVDTVPFNSIAESLQTGDLVLFSGVTSSGAIIKLFDGAQFSHVGLVLKSNYTSQPLVWEASTNKAGLVDIESGKVRKGVELIPLRFKIFSGWYDRVAIRRLTGIEDEKREELYKHLLTFRKEVQGRPYEQNKLELILASIDLQEKYLSFLRNTEEDLSSLFCSELVAEAYKRMMLLETTKPSNAFTPDDFSSSNNSHLTLNFGARLEPEVFVELKLDFETVPYDSLLT